MSSKAETRKIFSLIKAGEAFGRQGAPDRCREQTGRLQLDMDEVAHKMFFLFLFFLFENLLGFRFCFNKGGAKLRSDGKPEG